MFFREIKCNDGEQYYFSNKLLNVNVRCFKFLTTILSHPHPLEQKTTKKICRTRENNKSLSRVSRERERIRARSLDLTGELGCIDSQAGARGNFNFSPRLGNKQASRSIISLNWVTQQSSIFLGCKSRERVRDIITNRHCKKEHVSPRELRERPLLAIGQEDRSRERERKRDLVAQRPGELCKLSLKW